MAAAAEAVDDVRGQEMKFACSNGARIAPLTIFLRSCGEGRSFWWRSKIDQSMPIVIETEQVADRRNPHLKSRAQISDGSARRFFVRRVKICAARSKRYDRPAQSSGNEW